jgi:hypothetical protein
VRKGRDGREGKDRKKEGKGKETLLPHHLQNPGAANANEPDQLMQNYKQKV